MKILKISFYDEIISKFLFNLKNKNYVRKNSINKKIINYRDHKNWLKKFLKKNSLHIIFFNKKMAGYIRLKTIKNYKDCSWAILKKYQGKGLALKGLKAITKNKYKYRALIKKNNKASKKIAEKANFELKLIRNNIQYFYKN